MVAVNENDTQNVNFEAYCFYTHNYSVNLPWGKTDIQTANKQANIHTVNS